MPQAPVRIELSPKTLKAFDAYVSQAEHAMQATLRAGGPFLWCDADPKRERNVVGGDIEAEFWSGTKPVGVADGLIHDWVGVAFSQGTTLEQTLALVQNYDNHKNIYRPEVVDSKLISRQGNHFEIFLRLLKKKILTVVVDTYHDVHYCEISARRCFCQSHTTSAAEVENPGTAKEVILPPDTGYGFLWRLHSYWRFEEKGGGVFLECRAISLTRDIPLGLGWILDPIVRKLPRESLINTLAATRKALAKS
jgi:hypothetical protein